MPSILLVIEEVESLSMDRRVWKGFLGFEELPGKCTDIVCLESRWGVVYVFVSVQARSEHSITEGLAGTEANLLYQ